VGLLPKRSDVLDKSMTKEARLCSFEGLVNPCGARLYQPGDEACISV
jgi:hypothetical protein